MHEKSHKLQVYIHVSFDLCPKEQSRVQTMCLTNSCMNISKTHENYSLGMNLLLQHFFLFHLNLNHQFSLYIPTLDFLHTHTWIFFTSIKNLAKRFSNLTICIPFHTQLYMQIIILAFSNSRPLLEHTQRIWFTLKKESGLVSIVCFSFEVE